MSFCFFFRFSKAIPSESLYEEMIRNAAAYNRKIRIETKMRLPFLDSQTGVAQNHSDLIKTISQRQAGDNACSKTSPNLLCVNAFNAIIRSSSRVLHIVFVTLTGIRPGQVYSYPAKRWKKKRIRSHQETNSNKAAESEANETVSKGCSFPWVWTILF